MEKKIEVRKRYRHELGEIEYILKNLENGRYYENSSAKMDGYLSTNISNIRERLYDLIDKIENNKSSNDEKLLAIFTE